MRILVALIGVAILCAGAYAGINIPAGHQLIKQEGNYYTILNNTTNLVNTYYIEGQPATTSWPVSQLLEDSLIFQQVYYLDAFLFYKIFVHDFNNNGMPEIFAADMAEGVRTKFLENQGNFNFVEVHRIETPMATWGFGDTDNDGLYEILAQATDTFRLIEQEQIDSFPENMVWDDTTIGEPHISYGRIGDIDGDSVKDITFLNARYDPWRIEFFENSGNNQFIHRNPIVWQSGGPVDYSYADFDNDGKNEIVSALAPTGIMIFEYVGNDSFAPVWQTNLGCPNPYLHEYIGDNNGNGYGEWVSCGRDFNRSGFFFKVFEATGDNQYQVVYYDSLPGDCWEAGGLAHGDADNDGRNEFMVSANSNIGLYKYDPIIGWHLAWLCDQGGFATTYPFLLDVDNDGECEIVLSGELLRVRIYNRVHTGLIESHIVNSRNNNFSIYPNPSNNSLEISISGLMNVNDIKIYNITGKLVNTIPAIRGNYHNWDLHDKQGKEVSSGIYFIVADIDDIKLVKRALILR
jgi:hypothetical protein